MANIFVNFGTESGFENPYFLLLDDFITKVLFVVFIIAGPRIIVLFSSYFYQTVISFT